MSVLLAVLLAANPNARFQALKSLPDAAFSGVIELRMKSGTQLNVNAAGLSIGTRIAVDTNTLVGPHRGIFLPQNLMFSRTFDARDADVQRKLAKARCNGCEVADLTTYVRLQTNSRSLRDAWLLIDRLAALPDVEAVYPVLVPKAAAPTRDFTDDQGYMKAPPTGTDALFSLSFPEGRGKGIKIGDVEGGWDLQHEDLPACADYSEFPGLDDDLNHGTAVLGEMFGVDNAFGVTGIAPDATCQVASDLEPQSWNVAKAMMRHASHMAAGDVVLLEVHIPGPNTLTNEDLWNQVGYVPAEFDPATWDATDTLTKQGIIVVAAAGNGGENLDDPIYEDYFDPQTHMSGAIMVGAGAGSKSPVPNKRLGFSNYGKRVDVHAWGEQVMTLAYGDAQNILHREYTYQFSGTSSASPIVTASVAVVNGYLKAIKKPVLKARDMATLLISTGTPQAGGTTQHIGPLPNLRAALFALEVCGDGKKGPAEVCDDGNTTDGDGCSAKCDSDESCGNGIKDTAVDEVCDDGNTKAGDGCRADCLGAEVCGDGQLDAVKKEICDDGNKKNGDGCTDDCKGKEVCGDGTIDVDAGEVCDDSNTKSGDGCAKDCKSDEWCGNEIVDKDAGEECDGGADCDSLCKKKVAPVAPKPQAKTPDAEETTKTGCAATDAPATWGLLLLALFLRRRR